MIVDGMIASDVNVSDKGVGFQIMCKDLRDTFRVFIPMDNVNGEQFLNMGDFVKVDFNEFFPFGNEVRMEVKRVILDKGKKKFDFGMVS
ncbi:MAG: hypothetical protein HON76_10665 [Candidatus Scalindua sp.]|jgi:hypothetical protein|nr:hypothetical protein [Candidatus Scalindua sp.]MBT6562974.1 hypothetical protein [Candidatus Scalindua sp.]MBT7212671.1 hypothetical protein [Candidatus Scalindua sp.]MBT7592431.1 hypothetical protein [Candidatus Scalindua sp.]